jgi:putative endonuclease
VKTRLGEVDLVARRGRVLAFVEVKGRSSQEAAEQSIDRQRLRRVAAAAELLIPRFAKGADTIRIDVIQIVPGALAASPRPCLARMTGQDGATKDRRQFANLGASP